MNTESPYAPGPHLPPAVAALAAGLATGPAPSWAWTEAFPSGFAEEVEGLIAVLPEVEQQSRDTFAVLVAGERLVIPVRIYRGELPSAEHELLTERQRLMVHCLYTRHHDGRVRQRHLAAVIGSTEPWVVPFVVQLLGEYVLEILVDLRDGLREVLVPGARGSAVYGQFVVENPEFFARTERRLVSYWNEYHRQAYASFRGYPGGAALGLLREAASERAGRRWPDRTPDRTPGWGWGRVGGYC